MALQAAERPQFQRSADMKVRDAAGCKSAPAWRGTRQEAFMSRTLLFALPAVVLLAACGSPPPSPYESGYRYGYNDGYRSGYSDRYGYSYPRRHRNLQRPTDY
jgi:hypothetical protein